MSDRDRPRLHVHADHRNAAVALLDRCEDLLRRVDGDRPARLALPTGRSYVPFYAELGARHDRDEEAPDALNWRRATGLNLDELVLPAGHPRTFAAYMQHHVWSRTPLERSRFSIPDTSSVYGGSEAALARLCRDVDARAASLEPLDIALLGLGGDGHLAYNLPHQVSEETHSVELPDHLAAELEVPRAEWPLRAVTLGLGPLRRARRILLLVAGAEKAEAVRHLVEGEADPAWPCTLLRDHSAFEVFADAAAVERLSESVC